VPGEYAPSFIGKGIVEEGLSPILQGLKDIVFVSIVLSKDYSSSVSEVVNHLTIVEEMFNSFIRLFAHI
jgi:hypothetical protein